MLLRANAYYIIMKSCIYRLMVPYCDKLLYYEYTQNCHYNDIVHLNSKKIGRRKKKRDRERRRWEKIFTENGT